MVTLSEAKHVDERAWVRAEKRQGGTKLSFGGDWVVPEASHLDTDLRQIDLGGARNVEMDGTKIDLIDSSGAWLLLRTRREIEAAGGKIAAFTMPPTFEPLFETLDRVHNAPPVVIHHHHSFRHFLERTGKGSVHFLNQSVEMMNYLGRVTIETGEAIIKPRGNLRVAALFHQIEETGITALPIVGLLAFLLGVVLAYQGADQLKRFGAEIFTVNLVGVAVLREIGGLITAIIVAGRSGSAFTAQIGTMNVNEEIDAMQTIGLNTVDVLVLPRILGLLITLPLLTFYADMMGLAGGGVMSYFSLGLTIPVYMRQLQSAVSLSTLMVGLIKAPVFAFVIGLVGCFEGLKVERNAASVGKLTTRSVVESIFLVIVFDAAFSILFSILGI
jgi:phospholipid/cholesterol/gamma-HCH transport system permease protein